MTGLGKLIATFSLIAALAACSSNENAENTMAVDDNLTTNDMASVNNQLANEAGQELPEFKLPAPRPSAQTALPRSVLPAGTPTLEQVDDALRARLAKAGYDDLGYYRVTNGFALATGMERLAANGKPFAGAQRWETDAAALAPLSGLFSPATLIHALVNADPGSYRTMVFVVTNRPVTNSGAAMTQDTAKAMETAGASSLPGGFSKPVFTTDYRVTALIYEFKRNSVGKPAQFSTPSTRSGAEQLRLAGIL